MMDRERLKKEREEISRLLNSDFVSDDQYMQLYAAQQALAWLEDSDIAASPHKVIMQGKVSLPLHDVQPTGTLVS